ncbi:hypothetical protein SAMN05216355_11024 [Actinomyces ruminicola]|uniref:Transposase n=1 Tax=Actinomyces ruminicola TaxID=332524 RepID=A0A1H0DD39_9ACTO|nr:hypothetical protein [Actinomyces ruminicola]SDN68062.1 hypothetical protein SAMN05216355_11024 [Actinomyces ruminicola]
MRYGSTTGLAGADVDELAERVQQILDGTRIPLTVWFEVAWQMVASKNGASAAHLYQVLPVGSYQTVWAMLSRLRSVMGWSDSQPLARRVEVDETYLGWVALGQGRRDVGPRAGPWLPGQ